ncbi:hypothetical protein [Roseovarius salinarum]|uniref:hypothetical protein n=1 Tax=Roseovarius salinarum TaxID=1981892 RepID=UPI001300044A|nr:hypothetical protein [Roseovarius salinarum]
MTGPVLPVPARASDLGFTRPQRAAPRKPRRRQMTRVIYPTAAAFTALMLVWAVTAAAM